jgi:hypothetical protein
VLTPSDWATRLAGLVAPDEVELAPIVVAAYLEGGPARRDLFASAGSAHGAFVPGDVVAILPVVLKGIGLAAPFLLGLLTSEAAGRCLETAKKAAEAVAAGKSITDLFSRPASAPAGDLAMLRTVVVTMEQELRATGLSSEQCSLITIQVVKALLEQPADAGAFVKRLEEKR